MTRDSDGRAEIARLAAQAALIDDALHRHG
jgi:hypothetical protein